MKKSVQPLVQRPGEAPSGVLLPPVESRRPFRLWMTGSLAVVMAAMIPLRLASDAERGQSMRVLGHSRFDIAETLQRIEIAAAPEGSPCWRCCRAKRRHWCSPRRSAAPSAVMREADSAPCVPLGLMVRVAEGGGADVLVASVHDSDVARDWPGLPASVIDELRALPVVVERALG